MKIYRAGKNPQVIRCKGISAVLFVFTAAGFVAVLRHLSARMAENRLSGPYDSFSIVGIIVLTVTLFAGFLFLAQARGTENTEKLNALALMDDGVLLRLYYNVGDITAEHSSLLGEGIKLVRIVENAKIIQDINSRAEFLNSDRLEGYVTGVLSGALPYTGKIQIAWVQNPKIMKENRSGMEIYYTSGDYQRVCSFFLYRSHEGYDELHGLLEQAPCRVDFAGKKPGEYLVKARE